MIGFEHVDKTYGEKQVLRDFSLSLPERGSVALMGPSGGGKTTLLRLLTGLEKPDRGIVHTLAGRRVAIDFQEDRLLPWYTVRQNLALFTRDDPEAWLARIGLPEEGGKYPRELSGGMRRRVALARALSAESDTLVLDEPLKELDAMTRESMVSLIHTCAQGKLLILVTHNPVEARTLCQRIIHLEGTPLTIQSDE